LAAREEVVRKIGLLYAIGLGCFLVAGMPMDAGVALECRVKGKCPEHPKGTGGYELPECELVGPKNQAKACKPVGRECSPALECTYKTAPGAKRRCGTTIQFVYCEEAL